MPVLLVDDLDLPQEQRSLAEHLQSLWPEYEVLIELRESAWLDRALETIRIFVQEHSTEVGAVSAYMLKAIGDAAIDWAKHQFRKHPDNRNQKRITIYGPDGQAVRTALVKDADTVEE